ncbi:MAG: hypothetical protein ABIH36_00485 [bacterium]
MRKSESLLVGIKDIIAPRRCMGCLRENTWLCAACEQGLPNVALVQRNVKALNGIVSAGPYGLPALKRGIGWFKFKGVKSLAKPLGLLMIRGLIVIAPLAQLQEQATLVPIPLHKRRLRQRGFNQSEELAAVLEEYTGIPVLDVLVRKKATWTQTKLPPELRQENTKGAFALGMNELPSKRYWLLVDDVTTTGSTLSDAAMPLRQADANQVWGVTAARG